MAKKTDTPARTETRGRRTAWTSTSPDVEWTDTDEFTWVQDEPDEGSPRPRGQRRR